MAWSSCSKGGRGGAEITREERQVAPLLTADMHALAADIRLLLSACCHHHCCAGKNGLDLLEHAVMLWRAVVGWRRLGAW